MWIAIDLSIRAAIVLTLAWVAAAVLRRQPASVRAFAWTVAFGGLLALPIYARVAPVWHLEILQAPPRIEPAVTDAPPLAGVQRVASTLPEAAVEVERQPRRLNNAPLPAVTASASAPAPASSSARSSAWCCCFASR